MRNQGRLHSNPHICIRIPSVIFHAPSMQLTLLCRRPGQWIVLAAKPGFSGPNENSVCQGWETNLGEIWRESYIKMIDGAKSQAQSENRLTFFCGH